MNFEADFNDHCSKRNQKLLGLSDFDPIEYSDRYLRAKSAASVSIDPNANVSGISPNNYLSEIAKPYAKKYFFKKLYEKGSKLYSNFSLRHVYDGSIYIHDATKIQPYCFGVSATEIATEGRPYSTLPAATPKRFSSFMGQLTEFIMDCSQEFAGAVAITDLVPWMAWFIEKGKDKVETRDGWKSTPRYTDKEIENEFQSFVHVLNNSFRVGGDSPFTNISINSKMVYYDIFDHYTFPDGKTIDDLWETIKRVQKIIIDFMGKGRPDGLPYKFPILTANFKADEKEMESDWFEYVARHNHKGFMNMNFAERFAMCCRLQLDFDFKQNSFGGGGVKVGSMRVANINLPRVAYKAKEDYQIDKLQFKVRTLEDCFFDILDSHIDRSIEYLVAYHDVFKELIDVGYLKFFREPANWFNIKMFFATVGFCGIWDAAEIIYPDTLWTSNRESFNVLLLNKRVKFMENIVKLLVERTKEGSNGIKFNVEEVPSESAAGRMAKFNKDYGERKAYYSNQFIPMQVDIPLHERIEIESRLQSTLTGGGMTFLNFDAELTPEQSYEIHKYMLREGFTGQFCINYGYTQCPKCHTTKLGDVKDICKCGVPLDFFTRVVGYLAKMNDTADTKRLEIKERLSYTEPNIAR